jgi:hypothetical protein
MAHQDFVRIKILLKSFFPKIKLNVSFIPVFNIDPLSPTSKKCTLFLVMLTRNEKLQVFAIEASRLKNLPKLPIIQRKFRLKLSKLSSQSFKESFGN